MKEELILLAILLCIIAGSIGIGILLPLDFEKDIVSPLKYSQENNCSEYKDLFVKSECLRQELSSWYKYNLSNKNKDLSLEQLKLEGGVCRHFADWYISQFNNSEFYIKSVSMDTSETTAHKVALVSNEQGYCVLDQREKGCVAFENKSGELEDD